MIDNAAAGRPVSDVTVLDSADSASSAVRRSVRFSSLSLANYRGSAHHQVAIIIFDVGPGSHVSAAAREDGGGGGGGPSGGSVGPVVHRAVRSHSGESTIKMWPRLDVRRDITCASSGPTDILTYNAPTLKVF
ncbi:hypothetical protein GWI33_016344 [Rhynchophorus ferrugineus]|uniref:Uncharacterized protein n=1 Tax=Rhynchophorus ferrugineus TaxID=354439 RepID=A0A834HY65_RHYFE|nr:hypothetical protein GWI33_016344 [Rhynchophorus ferrugineus]